jgi:hypothetical protein
MKRWRCIVAEILKNKPMLKRKVKKMFSRTNNKCSVKAVKDVFKKT